MEKYPSVTRALFSGRLTAASASVHPYPVGDTELVAGSGAGADARESLQMMVEPVIKFFKETNNAMKNDETASIPPEITAALREMGAFGLQVPESLGGVGLSNTGCVPPSATSCWLQA